MYSLSGHPRCRWVSSLEQIWKKKLITRLAHQWILCSEWVPSEQLMKNITIIHMTPVMQKLRVCYKSIVKDIFNFFNFSFYPAKLRVPYPEYCFLQWNSCLASIRREMCTDQTLSKVSNGGEFWGERITFRILRIETFSLEEAWLWIMDCLKLKCLIGGFVSYKHAAFHKMLTDGLESCGLLWCFYQQFGLSFLMALIHYRGSTGKQVM